MKRPRLLFALAFFGLASAFCLMSLAFCSLRQEPPPPTFPGSATPSDTPIPPTATATPTLFPTVAPSVSPGTGTAVTSTPPGTVTAVPPATGTATQTATAAPTGTPTAERLLIVKGITYWDSAKAKYGRFECWQMLKAVNGWPERALPIGEFMRLPGTCDE